MASAHRLSRADFPSGPPLSRAGNNLFSIAVWPAPSGKRAKYTCVVSKKTAGSAVERNKIKRRTREAFSPLVSTLRPPLVIVVYPKRGALDAPFADLKRSLSALIGEIKRRGYTPLEVGAT